MPRFLTAAVEEVIPKRKQRQPSQRAQIQQQYREALQSALEEHQALVVVLESDDKPLTIRNRIKRAAESIDATDLVVRRRRDRIVAYRPSEEPS